MDTGMGTPVWTLVWTAGYEKGKPCNLISISWRRCDEQLGVEQEFAELCAFSLWFGEVRKFAAMASLIVAPSSLCCSSSAFFTPMAVRAASTSSSVVVSLPAIVCGRGDRRTAKGKRARGSFGNSRPKDSSKGTGLAVTPLPPRPKKNVEDTEYIHVDIDESLFNN